MSMSLLGDDELSLILKHLADRNDRTSFSLVCKRWLRLEGQTRLSIRVLDPDLLQSFLPRFPNLLHFESSKLITDAHLEFICKTFPKIESFNLGTKNTEMGTDNFDERDELCCVSDLGDDGLCSIANGCSRVSKVVLRRRVNVSDFGVVKLLECAKGLSFLDLGWCSLITDQSLEAMSKSFSIQVLNLEGCSKITDHGLWLLANGDVSKTLKKLVLAECDRITDNGVASLGRFCCLEELSLSECGPKLTDIGGVAISGIKNLKKLNLAWLINITDVTLDALAKNCPELFAIDLTGCELITGAGVQAFQNHSRLGVLKLASCYNVTAYDVEQTVLRCPSLSHIVLHKGLRMWMPEAIHELICRLCHVDWK